MTQGEPQTSEEPAPPGVHRCHSCAYEYNTASQKHFCPACGHFYQPATDPFKLTYSPRFLYEKLREQAEILQAAWKALAEKAPPT